MLIHIVRRGDTLYSIARRYGTSVARLRSDNGLTADQTLVVGQALIVTLPSVVHTVRPGDTLYSIARQYGVTVLELLQNNPELIPNRVIQPGQQLTVSFQGGKIRQIVTKGYAYPRINRNTLLRALPYLTYLAVFSYGFTETGTLIQADDAALIASAYEYSTAPILVFSSLDESGGFSTARASRLFNDPQLQETVLRNLVDVMGRKGYVGVDMDFEYIAPEDAQGYQAFLRRAVEIMAPEGYTVSADLAPKTTAGQQGLLYEAHDYPAIGAIVDRVLLMTYEWGYTYGPPMAVAPIDQVRQVARYAVSEIAPNKILLGVPNYGYDWTLPYEQGVSRAENIGNQGAVLRAGRYGAEIQFDETAQSPFFEYYNAGRRHIVWFEDVRSIEAKLALTDEFGLLGVGYWNIMRAFDQNWAFLAARYSIAKVV